MGIFSRFRDIVNSNVNAMLDKAEDPEKMIRLIMQEMEDTLVDLKSSCAAKMAVRAEMERDRDAMEAKVTRWSERATLAVQRQRDDLAKEALHEKKQCERQLEFTENDLEHYEKLIAECKDNIIKLEEKLNEVTLKHKILIQRGVHAAERKRVQTAVRNAGNAQAIRRFSELENRIERMEAEADLAGPLANGSLEHEFSKLEAEDDIEEELSALKKNLKGAASKTSAGKDNV